MISGLGKTRTCARFYIWPLLILPIAISASADRISAEVRVYLRFAWSQRRSTLTLRDDDATFRPAPDEVINRLL